MSWSTGVSLRRIIITAGVAVIVLVVVGGFAWTWRSAVAPISDADRPRADEKTFRHGAELAAIGNCNDCHQAAGGQRYAGGRALETPFGTIFSSNITPDADTGIGTWSQAAFERAMRDGVDREGRQLYPAFPYNHFTMATDDDLHALYVFLMSASPVHNVVPANKLEFPFNYRPLVAGWKILFLREGTLEPDSSQSPQWNRGRYLVEGLGHCGDCHTPRNALGAEKRRDAFAGAIIEGWEAPALNDQSQPAHAWTVDQLAEYLSTGWTRWHGASAGPMTIVTRNLSEAQSADVRAMATYVASLLPQSGSAADATSLDKKNVPGASPEVIAIFTGACANCHDDGNGVGPSKAVSLALSSAVRQPGAANAVRVILQGIQPAPDAPGAYMPAFADMFTDRQIASLAEYVRARYTNLPQWTEVPSEIAKARQ
jgi:mono/diheme cytochrome c family protein